MKGRIIGRQGQTFVLSSGRWASTWSSTTRPRPSSSAAGDPIRREVARMALSKLVADGRIHPARIEKEVEKAQ